MTTQLNQLTELTVTSDDDLILIREDSTGVDKRMKAQNIRAKATTKGDVGLGNVPDLDTTDAVNKAHDQNSDTALAQGTGDQVTASEARSHIDATDNPHGVTKAQVGLANVPNLDTTDAVSKAHDQNTDTALAQGTANEVTAADARAHIDATDNPHSVTKAQVGLSDVDNVSAADLRDRSTHTGTQTLATISDAGTIASQNADSVSITGGNIDATIEYDNTSSGLSSTNVQAAIDEVTGLTAATQASAITYDNTASGLVAQDVQAAIDELQSITAAEDAININYDNTASGLVAEDVQAAIDEVQGGLGTIAAQDANDVAITGGNIDATLAYDNTASGLTATNVQAAIDELEARPAVEDADQITYDNTASGLVATDVQAAIDEVQGGLGTIAAQDADDVAITGGTINNTPIGGTTAESGAFTTLGASSTITVGQDYTETLASSTGSTSIDLSNGTVFKVTTDGNNTITLPSSTAGKSFLVLVEYGGSHTITWAGGSDLYWPDGQAPDLTSEEDAVDVFAFFQDGDNTYGIPSAQGLESV